MNGCKGYYLLSQIRGNLPVADMQSAARSAGTLVGSGPRFRAPLLCHTIGKVDRGGGGPSVPDPATLGPITPLEKFSAMGENRLEREFFGLEGPTLDSTLRGWFGWG